MVMLSLGNKKRQFRSIKEAASVVGIPYITLYQRLRAGENPASAVKRPVRAYRKSK